MTNKAGIIFGALSIILLVIIFFLMSSNALYKSQANNANVLAKDVSSMLKAMNVRCLVSYRSIDRFDKECVRPLLIANDFKEEKFLNVKGNESGYLVIKNKGVKSYDSNNFFFYKNNNLENQGCVISGKIGPQYTCRFNFNKYCEKGDVLEVKYNGSRVFLRNC